MIVLNKWVATLGHIVLSVNHTQFLFPLLYLLLKCQLRIIKMSCSIILHEDELISANLSLTNIFEIVRERINTIGGCFYSPAYLGRSTDVNPRDLAEIQQ